MALLEQFDIETHRAIGTLQGLLPGLTSYERGQTLQDVAGDHRDGDR